MENGRRDFCFTEIGKQLLQDDFISRLKGAGIERIVLVPLMLTAGIHAEQELDRARQGSLSHQLERAGFSVEPFPHGLGEYPEVRKLYLEHYEQAQYL